MQVRFDYTQADMVDVSKRVLARSRAVRRWRWQGLVATASIAWLLVFFFFWRTPVRGAVIASLAALFSALMFPSQHQRTTEARLRKYLREKFGDKNDFVCEVEITEAGISVTHVEGRNIYDWSAVEDIVVTNQTVDIFTRGGGLVVRDRAFHSADEKQKFVELARTYLAQTPPLHGDGK